MSACGGALAPIIQVVGDRLKSLSHIKRGFAMGFEDILGEISKQLEKQLGVGDGPAPPSQSGGRPAPSGTTTTTQPAPAHPHSDVGDVMKAVVQVVALRQGFLGGMSSAWTGSGSVVHPAGLILTNCHVASPRDMGMSAPPADRLAIAVTESSDEPPAVSYFVDVVAKDPQLDLAVLQVVADVRGRPVRGLELPFVEIGDSDALQLGERLAIFGYPGIGGETVTYTAGNVSGFTGQRGVQSHRAWIKTDATIAGGNSGGTAVNESGQLVGIPTQAAAGAGVVPVDARPVLDTNRDGVIDERDSPMAVGGFINGLRPINLAYPLLEKAGLRIDVKAPGHVTQSGSVPPPSRSGMPAPSQRASFRELLFCTRVMTDGRPVNPTTQVPAGIDTVYATFEYDGMQNGTPWSIVWMTGGQQIIDQQDEWDDGPQGRKAVKVSNRRGLPEGEYHLVLGIGGSVALEGKVMVGTPVDETDSEVSGRLVDSESRSGIAGGMAIVLKPHIPLQQFLKTQDQQLIYTSAETGRDGSFTLQKQLPKGQAYSLIAATRGYSPVAVEGALRIGSTAPERANVGDIELTRGF
jgi:hypothetical protein